MRSLAALVAAPLLLLVPASAAAPPQDAHLLRQTTDERRLDTGLGEGQVLLYPTPFFVVDGMDYRGSPVAYLEQQGIQTSIEVQSWLAEHGYATLRAFMDDNSRYSVTEEALFDCGLTFPNTETQPIPTNGSLITSGYTLDGPCEVWLDDKRVLAGRNCHTEFPDGHHAIDYSSCGDKCRLSWFWLGVKYLPERYSWQVFKNCVNLVAPTS